jgi:hypothetical protein
VRPFSPVRNGFGVWNHLENFERTDQCFQKTQLLEFLMHFRQTSTGEFKNSPLRRGHYPQPRFSWSQLILRKSMKPNLNRKHIRDNLGCVYSTRGRGGERFEI